MRMRKSLLTNLVLSGASLAVSLALIEVGFRLVEGVREPAIDTRLADVHPVRDRPPEDFLILGIGESSMMGGPYANDYSDHVSPLRIVAHYLGRIDTRRRFVTAVHAGAGRSLDNLLDTAGPVLSRRPDLIVVAAGHNDFMAAFPPDAGCDRYRQAGPSFLERSAAVRFFETRWGRRHLGDVPTSSARRLLDVPIACPADWRRTLRTYERALDAVATFGERAGIPVVFVSLAAAEAAWSPVRSVYRGAEERGAEFEALYRWGRYHFEQGALGPARECLDEALQIDPTFAEALFRLAEIDRAEGRDRAAQARFEGAKEHDGFPWRVLNAQRQSLRAVAARHDVPVVDVRDLLLGAGATLPYLDGALFHDIHHPTIRGYHLMAQGIVRAAVARGILGTSTEAAPSFLDDAALLAALGFDRRDWTITVMSAIYWHENSRYYVNEKLDRDRLLLEQFNLMRLLDPRRFAAVYEERAAQARREMLAARAGWDTPPPGGSFARCRAQPLPASVSPAPSRRWDERPRDAEAAVRDFPWFRLALDSRPSAAPVHVSGVPSVSTFYRLRAPRDGKGEDGRPLQRAGHTYERGFVLHPAAHFDAEAVFVVDGRYRRFESTVGIVDPGDETSSAVCGVFGDGKRLFQSRVLRAADAPESVAIDVSGVRELELSCTSLGDGDVTDYAAWLEPRLIE